MKALFVVPAAILALLWTLPSPQELDDTSVPAVADVSLQSDCTDVGNMICAPGNVRHVPPGCYDDGGVLEFDWPCDGWSPADGYRHGDGTITYPPQDCPTYAACRAEST